MIEENRDLNRSFEIYKAFAVYNMVIVHGLAMLIGLFPTEAYHELGHHGLRFIRSAFSMTLPIFAGFYLRHFIGPFLQDHRLGIKLQNIIIRIVYMAFIIEAVRQFLMRWHFRHSFSWHSLHFCALSFLISVLLAKKDSRLIGLFAIFLLVLRLLFPDPTFSMGELSELELQMTAILWGASFGVLAWGWSFQKKELKAGFKYLPLILISVFGCYIISNDHRELRNFYHLPYSMLFLMKADASYWPLTVFFPFFAAGYFFRSILFDIRKKYLFFPLLIFSCLGVLISYLNLPELSQELARGPTIRREAFGMPPVHVIGIISFFYLSWSITYLIFRKNRFHAVDRWVKWTGSVILVYVIHTALFTLTVKFLTTINYPESSLVFLYFLLHIIYVISLVICYHVPRIIPKLLGSLR